jgi:hypothetical protein
MSQNYTTYFIALVALVIYSGYIVSVEGIAGFLLSVAIGLIAAAFLDSIEYLTAIIILTGLAYSMYSKRTQVVVISKKEGFKVGEGEGTGPEIVARVVAFDPPKPPRRVSPVLSAGCEGFEDISTGTTPMDTPPPTSEGSSTPASTASVTKPKQTDKDAAEVVAAGATPANSVAMTGVQPVADPSAASNAGTPAGSAGLASAAMTPPAVAGFQGQKNTGLFKLGEMPHEQKGGPFVDVASTMNKAVSSLNTDQMAAMTAESKSLMETQRNLMNMLQSMSPVLQDGRRLLDTFSGIFGGLDGVLPNK